MKSKAREQAAYRKEAEFRLRHNSIDPKLTKRDETTGAITLDTTAVGAKVESVITGQYPWADADSPYVWVPMESEYTGLAAVSGWDCACGGDGQ